MAVTGISHKEAVDRQHKMEAWSGVISWTLYGLLAVLVIAVVCVLLEGQRSENRQAELRAVWDQYYLAFKDKQPAAGKRGLENADRIPILEGLWEKVKGTPVQPFVALELAQCHYREAMDALRDPDTGQRTQVEDAFKNQRNSLEKALKVYEVVLKNWSDNLAYGPMAYEGAALCQEQLKNYTDAIGILEDGIKKHSKHFLMEKMRYDLARNYWLRALQSEAERKDGAEDRSRALEHISRAVSEVVQPNDLKRDMEMMSWRMDARYLRSLLKKDGSALGIFPDGKPPKLEPKNAAGAPPPAPNVTPEAQHPVPNAAPEAPKAGERPGAGAEKKPAAEEKKPAAEEKKPAAEEKKPDAK